MPSISGRPVLLLSLRRAEVTGFWIVAVAVLGGTVAAIAAVLGAAAPWVWSAGAAGILLPRLIWGRWFEVGVSVWNRAARAVSAVLRWYTLWVTHAVLLRAVAVGGSPLLLDHPTRSGWLSRPRTDPTRASAETTGRDAQNILRFAGSEGHAWALCLVPAVLLLSLLQARRQDAAPPTSTYTLY